MRKILFLCIFLLLLIPSISILAQDDECSSFNINRQIDSWYNEFLGARSEVDAQASMAAAADLQTKINNLLETCGLTLDDVGDTTEQSGYGTESVPYDSDAFGAAGEFVEIMVTDDLRPAEDFLAEEDKLPANQPEGTEYIIVYLEFNCSREVPGGGCNLTSDAFQLRSDSGEFYQPAPISFSADVIETRDVPAGGTRSGGIPFLINATDTGLQLLYYPSGDKVNEQPYYYHAQIAPTTFQITTDQQSLPVRGGPGIVYGPVGDFQDDETATAIGISEDGEWLYITTDRTEGWVPVAQIISEVRLDGLPIREFEP